VAGPTVLNMISSFPDTEVKELKHFNGLKWPTSRETFHKNREVKISLDVGRLLLIFFTN